jgi:hypothetical protein
MEIQILQQNKINEKEAFRNFQIDIDHLVQLLSYIFIFFLNIKISLNLF